MDAFQGSSWRSACMMPILTGYLMLRYDSASELDAHVIVCDMTNVALLCGRDICDSSFT